MTDTLEEMRARKVDLTAKARSITDVTDMENRELTSEEGRQFATLMADVTTLTNRIEREVILRRAEEEQTRSHRAPTKPDVGPTETEAQVYGQPARFRSLGEQMQAVVRAGQPGGNVDPRLLSRAVSGMSEGVPSDGGFLVQTDFATELLKRTYETGQVASRCRRIGISANANGIKLNAIDETSRADGSRWGGVKTYWQSEAADKSGTYPHFTQIELSLKKMTGLAYVTDELLADANALESVLMTAFSEEFGFRLDDAIINGVGGGQPLGILASPALVTVAIEGGQLADTVVTENLVKIWARCFGRSRLNAVWFINQDIEPQLFTMALQVGLGGVNVYMPPGGLSGAPYGTLFGRPVIAIEQAATLGDLGDIILADLSQYVLIEKGGIQSASSIHVRFVNDESVFRFVYRVDGAPIWKTPLIPFKGAANTQGPFVTLAAR